MTTSVDVLAALRQIADGEGDAQVLAMRVHSAVAELIEAAAEIRTSLNITRSNVMTEIKRGAKQWDGVPDLLQKRIDTFDAALARVKGA